MDQDGDVIDILVTKKRNKRAAKRFFRKVLKGQGQAPWQLTTDKLRSYPAAHREVFPSVKHRTGQYANNRAEVSHQHTREQECQMRRFKSMSQAQRFLSLHGPIQNLFRIGRHHLKAVHHRLLRDRAFANWREATCGRPPRRTVKVRLRRPLRFHLRYRGRRQVQPLVSQPCGFQATGAARSGSHRNVAQPEDPRC